MEETLIKHLVEIEGTLYNIQLLLIWISILMGGMLGWMFSRD